MKKKKLKTSAIAIAVVVAVAVVVATAPWFRQIGNFSKPEPNKEASDLRPDLIISRAEVLIFATAAASRHCFEDWQRYPLKPSGTVSLNVKC